MSKKVVTNYKGMKYSLQPHGLKTRSRMLARWVLSGVASFILALGSALLAASPADAATTPTPIDSCLDGWFWKAGSGENETPPSLTPDGLLFNDDDTVNAVIAWHLTEATPEQAQITGDEWSMADIIGTPGPNTAFKVITDPWTGTWNYQGAGNWWSSGYAPNGVAQGDYTNATMLTALAGAGASPVAFGIGTEKASTDQPGFIVRWVAFAGETYSLICTPLAPATVTVTETVVVTRTVTESPSVTVEPTPSASPSVEPTPSPTLTRSSQPVVPPVQGEDGSSLLPWMVGVAGATGAALMTAGVVGIVRRRRRPGRHAVNNDETQMIPAYDPNREPDDYSGWGDEAQSEPWFDDGGTVEEPPAPVSDQLPPDEKDTGPLPPAV